MTAQGRDAIAVLLVDDEEALRELAARMLGGMGDFRVTTAGSGDEALALLAATPFDAIVADYQMPGMDGIALLRAVKERGIAAPFLLFTGRGREEVAIAAQDAGAAFYVRKGGDPASQFAELAHKVRQAVAHARAEAALSASVAALTDQQRVLAERETFYRAVFENTGTAMMVLEEDTTVALANAECERMTGYDRAAIEGKKRWPEFVAEEDRARMLALHRARREPGSASPKTYEFTLVAQDGERRRIFLTVDLIPGTRQSVASLIDITVRVRAEEGLKKAGQKLLLLSAITRHDILNKLTVLLGYVDLALLVPAPPPLPDYLAKIHAVAGTLESQVQFTREYQSLGMDTPFWQGIAGIMAQVRDGLTPGSVAIDDRSGTLEVYADPLLAKVIYNLLENALRHGQTLTTITVRHERAGRDVLLIVEDDGAGVPAGEKERIFEKGFGNNTGLGLFIAREVLSITNITIAETGEPGKGARFVMRVPAGSFRFGRKGT